MEGDAVRGGEAQKKSREWGSTFTKGKGVLGFVGAESGPSSARALPGWRAGNTEAAGTPAVSSGLQAVFPSRTFLSVQPQSSQQSVPLLIFYKGNAAPHDGIYVVHIRRGRAAIRIPRDTLVCWHNQYE